MSARGVGGDGGRFRDDLPEGPTASDPQDRWMDRRFFLQRMGMLTAAALTGGGLPRSVAGAERVAGSPLGGALLSPFLRAAERELRARQPLDPVEATAWEAALLIREGALAPSELVRACLDRVERWDPTYMAFNEVLAEAAMERALALDDEDPSGPLHGIPLAIKDNYYTEGVRTTANSWIFEDFVPEYDATAVRRLREGGGVILGKTQMGPLATTRALTPDGRITTVSAWAPGDPSVSPGGSSSGSATAVAARLATSSIGTQTGGSITAPALAQGLTGLKPTMGRVSLRGVIPLSYTRDHPGPIARDARDAALLLQTMAGPDPADPRTLGLPPVPDLLTAATPVERGGSVVIRWPTRIGVLPGWVEAGNEDVSEARRAFLEGMERLGAELVEIELPDRWEEYTSGSFNGARLPERSEPFLEALKQDVRLFGVTLSSWINGLLLSGDEYLKAQRVKLAFLRLVLDEVFSECDVVVQTGPVPFDMIGLPLLALPIGTRTQGDRSLPQGVILGGLPFGEERLLALAAGWQAVTDWHRMRPEDPTPQEELRLGQGGRGGRGRLGVEVVAERSQ